jgi:hypothetical protein
VTLSRVDDTSEIKQSVQIENTEPEKRNDQTGMLCKKRLCDSGVEDEKEIDYGFGIVVESGTDSDNVSESKNKTDQNASDVKAKDVGAEAKSMETTSGRTCVINRDLSPLWDSYVLAVKGIPPKESGVSYKETHLFTFLLVVCLRSLGCLLWPNFGVFIKRGPVFIFLLC